MLGSLAQSASYVTDTLFVGRLGEVPLAALGLGALVYWLLATVGSGLAVGLQVSAARRVGRRRSPGRLFDNALVLSLALAAALSLAAYAVAPLLAHTLVRDAHVARETAVYLRAVVWALPAGFAWQALAAFHLAAGRARVVGLATALTTVTNGVLNYAWVWGGLGGSALGIAGTAWATVVAECVGAAALVTSLVASGMRRRYGLLRHPPRWRMIRHLGRLGAPLVARQWVETAGWFGFFVLVGELGSQALAVSNIVRSIYTVVSLPSLALASAIYTLLGRHPGASRAHVWEIVRRAVVLSLAVSVPPGLAILLVPGHVGAIFTSDAALLDVLVPLAPVVAAILLFFAVSHIGYSTLVGVGAGETALRIEVLAMVLYLAAAFLLVRAGLSLPWVWASELLYWLALAGMTAWFFRARGRQ